MGLKRLETKKYVQSGLGVDKQDFVPIMRIPLLSGDVGEPIEGTWNSAAFLREINWRTRRFLVSGNKYPGTGYARLTEFV